MSIVSSVLDRLKDIVPPLLECLNEVERLTGYWDVVCPRYVTEKEIQRLVPALDVLKMTVPTVQSLHKDVTTLLSRCSPLIPLQARSSHLALTTPTPSARIEFITLTTHTIDEFPESHSKDNCQLIMNALSLSTPSLSPIAGGRVAIQSANTLCTVLARGSIYASSLHNTDDGVNRQILPQGEIINVLPVGDKGILVIPFLQPVVYIADYPTGESRVYPGVIVHPSWGRSLDCTGRRAVIWRDRYFIAAFQSSQRGANTLGILDITQGQGEVSLSSLHSIEDLSLEGDILYTVDSKGTIRVHSLPDLQVQREDTEESPSSTLACTIHPVQGRIILSAHSMGRRTGDVRVVHARSLKIMDSVQINALSPISHIKDTLCKWIRIILCNNSTEIRVYALHRGLILPCTQSIISPMMIYSMGGLSDGGVIIVGQGGIQRIEIVSGV